jgi:hypothetical protein
LWCTCHYHPIRAAESGFGLWWRIFSGPPSQRGRAKNLYSKSESWLSVAEWLGLGLKRSRCTTTN